MSEQSKPNSPEPNFSNAPESQPTINDEDEENPTSTNPIKEFIDNFRDKGTATNIEELWQGLRVANVFIDARSGGAYFANDAKIEGDVVGRFQSNRNVDIKQGNYNEKIEGNYYEQKRTISATSSYAQDIAGTILNTEIEKILSVYVQTSNYNDAKSILNNKHILILQGEPHFGKRTTAIHLLLSVLDTKEILEIDPTLEEEDLKKFHVAPKQLYLIDTLNPDSAEKLYSFVLNHLGQKLKKQNSFLAITIDSHTRLAQELGLYVLQWREFLVSNTLLKKHLVWYLENQKFAQIDSVTQQEPVRELLKNKLLPGEVDRLAELLAKVIKNELSLEKALASLSGQAKQQVETWFDQERDIGQIVFTIALSVLSGSKYQTVISASQSLQFLIENPLEKEEISYSDSLFKKRRSERLKEVNAHLTQGSENTEFGHSPVELVELDNSAFQPAILAYVWDEYDFYRDKLLQWLYELGTYSNFEIRIRAAAAAGELSKYALKDVLDLVIRPWANCQQQPVQKLASLALSVSIFEGNLAPQVLKLLHSWSGLKNNSNLRWTATNAYGSYIGLRFPDVALRDLFKITQSGDKKLVSAVANSVIILFEAGNFVPSQYYLVLDALQDWTSKPKKTLLHQSGLLIFWMLMGEFKALEDSNQAYWPTLLWLAQEDLTYESIIIQLLRRSLNQKQLPEIENFPLRKRVLEKIYNWLQLVDDDTRLYPVLGTLIYKLIVLGEEREKLRILRKLEEWKLTGQSKAASKIFSKISKEL